MNNLYRELAPITAKAWEEIEQEATRTFKRHIAGRRVVDFSGPHGLDFSAVGLGQSVEIKSPGDGVTAYQRVVAPVVELRVPFTLTRRELDNVDRGAHDTDLDPVRAAAKRIAFAEDRVIFEGYEDAGIAGVRASATNRPVALPEEAKQVPEAIAQALTQLRLAGVGGPYNVLLSADLYTLVSEVNDHGHPVRELIKRQIEGDVIWAPAIDGAFVLTTRGGDFELSVGRDLSIGYRSHDAESVELYLEESLTFQMHTGEAAVSLS